MNVHSRARTLNSNRRKAMRLVLASAVLLVAGAGAGVRPAAAQSAPDPTRAPITEDMLRRVGAPARPDADLRIEVRPGTAPDEERKARRPKAKDAERRP